LSGRTLRYRAAVAASPVAPRSFAFKKNISAKFAIRGGVLLSEDQLSEPAVLKTSGDAHSNSPANLQITVGSKAEFP
jgi:hypothetical protein